MKFLPLLVLLVLFSGSANAATNQDVNNLTTYAVILGRAVGCGFDADNELKSVGSWIDGTFSGEEKKAMLGIFVTAMQKEAKSQISGTSPDSCSSVRETMQKINWP